MTIRALRPTFSDRLRAAALALTAVAAAPFGGVAAAQSENDCDFDPLAYAPQSYSTHPYATPPYATPPRPIFPGGIVPVGAVASADDNLTYRAPQVIEGRYQDEFQGGYAPPSPAGAALGGPPPFAANGMELPPVVPQTFVPAPPLDGQGCCEPYRWQVLPQGVLFKSFIAGVHAERMAAELVNDGRQGTLLDGTLGSRIGLVRYGTSGPNAEGWELDITGAAFLRLGIDDERDLQAVDFRVGVPITYRKGPTAYRFGYDHISAHAGDEFLIKNPGFNRINYVREELLFGVSHFVNPDFQVYGEFGYAFITDGGAKPIEFQFGAEYAPLPPPGRVGAPVVAVNTHVREDFDYQGSFGTVAGWQWRGTNSPHVLRLAFTFYTGHSRQFAFFQRYETLSGVGLFYDF